MESSIVAQEKPSPLWAEREDRTVYLLSVGIALLLHGIAAASMARNVQLDRDHDGIVDARDRCPDQPETFNGFEDQDGCPDAPPSVVAFEEPPPPPPPPPPPVEPPPPPPEPVAETPPPPPSAPTPHAPPPPVRNNPAPAPTRAAPVMTAVAPPEFDMSNDDVVAVGDNVNATGDTASDGVVRPPGEGVSGARPGGVGNGHGHDLPTPAPPAPPPVDYSAHARLSCDEETARDEMPSEAVQAGISEERVRVRVTIDGTGRVTHAAATNNPGYGFAAAAERVARNASCRAVAARDRAGNVVADTIFFTVTFRVE